MNDTQYRQQVAEFRNRLTDFAQGDVPQGKRIHIDKEGRRSRFMPSPTAIERMTLYGKRRFNSIVRVMALFEVTREHENLAARSTPVTVTAAGAYWQAFQGTTLEPACHTCPGLLMLDGELPTLITSNIGLRRHIIVAFADCMIMPVSINKVDRYFDDSLGWPAFEHAASMVLNSGRSWRDGVSAYAEGMRLIFGDMISILNRDYFISDPELREQFEACKAFYEGLFLTPINQAEMNNYLSSVRAEMNIA
ncbi:MAG: hypothetical protein AAFN78_10460 [Pseudomonadota bacterium]